jgi:hypothetical protein
MDFRSLRQLEDTGACGVRVIIALHLTETVQPGMRLEIDIAATLSMAQGGAEVLSKASRLAVKMFWSSLSVFYI